jgi:hypothetical protein
MKENEIKYPELERYPLYWTAITERTCYPVNDIYDELQQSEKENEISNNHLILITAKVVKALQSDKEGQAHGETFEQNVRDMLSAYKPDDIFRLCKHTESGRFEMKFESTTYGGDGNREVLEISLLGECQEEAFEDETECGQPEVVHSHAYVTQHEPSYNIDHGC